MVKDIKKLKKAYPDLIQTKVIGKSEYGRDIYAFSVGRGEATVFINGSHHAREWLTTSLNMYMAENYAIAYQKKQKINGYDARKILNSTTIWFVPMVNPDGVILQQEGLKAYPKNLHASLIKMNEGSKNFKRWKANGKGVDLNRQYDAGWEQITGPTTPRYKNYKGKAPHTAAETKAILRFIEEINPEMTVAYHSTGKILYWNYKQNSANYKRDHVYAKQIGKMTGYRLVYPGKNPSGGGLTDWFIQEKKRPGFTPEISRYYYETNPPLSEFPGAWKENKAVGLYVAQEGANLLDARYEKTAISLTKEYKSVQSSARKLKNYYYTNIQSTTNLKVSTKFVTLYNTVNKDLKKLEKASAKLPAKYQKQHASYSKTIKYHLSKSKWFMDGVKAGEELQQQDKQVTSKLEKGQLDSTTIKEYNNLKKSIASKEKAIAKMYGKGVRKLATAKYITPAKITIENNEHEFLRYNLTVEMEKQVSDGKIDLVKENLLKLTSLEEKSKQVKAKGKAYKVYPSLETMLANKKQWIIDELKKLEEQGEPGNPGEPENPEQPDNSAETLGQQENSEETKTLGQPENSVESENPTNLEQPEDSLTEDMDAQDAA